MKNLCFVCFNIEDMGGITRVMSNICRELELSRDYKLSIVSICDTGKESHYRFSENIKIFKLSNNPSDRIRNIIFKSFSPLKRIFSDNHFDIIFMEGHYIPPIVLPLKFFIKSKFVFCDHGSLTNQIKDKKATLFRRLSSKMCEKVVVLTNQTKDEYKKIFGISDSKISVIPNFIDEDIFKFKREYDVNSKIILSSGRFTKEKGFDMLIDVASMVLSKHPDWQWRIYGDGPEREKIEVLIKEKKLRKNVKLMGLADNMYEKYKDAGIFVLTSYREGFALVLLEAKASGIPMVSFDISSGPSEIISNAMDGYLIPCYNKAAMSAKICALIENDDLRKRFSEHTQIGIENFLRCKVMEKWNNVIRELL